MDKDNSQGGFVWYKKTSCFCTEIYGATGDLVKFLKFFEPLQSLGNRADSE